MRYEKSNRVGEVWHTEEYEGTPEEITQLIDLQNKPKKLSVNVSVSVESLKAVSETIEKGLAEMHKGEKILRQG